MKIFSDMANSSKPFLRMGLLGYLFLIFGFLAPLHHFEIVKDSHNHSDCQLCHVSTDIILTQSNSVVPTHILFYEVLVQNISTPKVAALRTSFSPRGPPTV